MRGCWRRGRVGAVVGGRCWRAVDRRILGPDVAGVLWRGVHCPSRLGPAEDPPLVTVGSEVLPLSKCGRGAGSSEGLVERPAPRHLGAPNWARFATQLVNSLRGTLDMDMREMWPAHRRRQITIAHTTRHRIEVRRKA